MHSRPTTSTLRRSSRVAVVSLCAGILALSVDARGQDRRPVTVDDIMAMKTAGSPAISPDGAWVVYTVRQWENAPC
jgi:hypothetical protein